jgi:preprotein translocase subunit YajC
LDFAVFAFQNVPPRPGQGETAPATAVEQKPASGGEAPPPGGGLFGMLMPLLLVGMIVFLFWSNRSQQKKQEATISGLKKGDKVVTQSGLVGRLVDLEPRYAKLEVAPGVKLQVLRTSLVGRDVEEAAASKKEAKTEPPAEKKA